MSVKELFLALLPDPTFISSKQPRNFAKSIPEFRSSREDPLANILA